MPKNAAPVVAETPVDIETIDALLDDLDLGAADSQPVIEELIEEPVGDLNVTDADLNLLEADLERAEVYENQTSTISPDASAPAAAKTNPVKSANKASGTPKSTTPRTPRDLNTVDDAVFVLDKTMTLDAAGLAANKASVMAMMPKQKKVAEKFENLFTAISVNKAPSTFVTIAFKLLDSKGSMSSTELVAAYKTVGAKSDTEGYNEGTARSQAGQMMALFETVKIATRVKQDLTINPNSMIADRLRTILNTSVAP